ncbi:hypothetical protein BGX21_000497, partial [Mortierella sp. AD011]
GLTEAYWRIHAWPCIDTLLDNIDDVHLIPGEGQALDSIARRNIDREPGPYKSPRKRAGKNSGWKIPREMHDILRGRMRETSSESARKIQILGIVLSANDVRHFGKNITVIAHLLKIKRLVMESMKVSKQRRSLAENPLEVWDNNMDEEEEKNYVQDLHSSPPDPAKKRDAFHSTVEDSCEEQEKQQIALEDNG